MRIQTKFIQGIISNLLPGILIVFLLLPRTSIASFIESTMGTAVVNDATATYNNPAALTLVDNTQVILLGSAAQFNEEFTGSITQSRTGFTQSGSSNSTTYYFLPSGYFAVPVSDKLVFGTAVLVNDFSRDVDQNSILRYAMPNNSNKAIDLIPAVGLKLTDYLSIGAGLNFSQADFLSNPTSGFPSLNVPDDQSNNDATANALGGDLGILLKPTSSTLVGFNYRSSMTYHFKGTSTLEGKPGISSDDYSFDFWTPARYVFSINQFLSRAFGLIGTVQWIKWDIFDKINFTGVATQAGPTPVVLSDVTVPLHMHNGWVYTFGGYYRLTPKWIVRTAASYVESPANANYQITNGDNIVLGTSIGYKLSKKVLIDGSYSHVFIQNQTIDVQNTVNNINGITEGYRDAVSLKLTVNL